MVWSLYDQVPPWSGASAARPPMAPGFSCVTQRVRAGYSVRSRLRPPSKKPSDRRDTRRSARPRRGQAAGMPELHGGKVEPRCTPAPSRATEAVLRSTAAEFERPLPRRRAAGAADGSRRESGARVKVPSTEIRGQPVVASADRSSRGAASGCGLMDCAQQKDEGMTTKADHSDQGRNTPAFRRRRSDPDAWRRRFRYASEEEERNPSKAREPPAPAPLRPANPPGAEEQRGQGCLSADAQVLPCRRAVRSPASSTAAYPRGADGASRRGSRASAAVWMLPAAAVDVAWGAIRSRGGRHAGCGQESSKRQGGSDSLSRHATRACASVRPPWRKLRGIEKKRRQGCDRCRPQIEAKIHRRFSAMPPVAAGSRQAASVRRTGWVCAARRAAPPRLRRARQRAHRRAEGLRCRASAAHQRGRGQHERQQQGDADQNQDQDSAPAAGSAHGDASSGFPRPEGSAEDIGAGPASGRGGGAPGASGTACSRQTRRREAAPHRTTTADGRLVTDCAIHSSCQRAGPRLPRTPPRSESEAPGPDRTAAGRPGLAPARRPQHPCAAPCPSRRPTPIARGSARTARHFSPRASDDGTRRRQRSHETARQEPAVPRPHRLPEARTAGRFPGPSGIRPRDGTRPQSQPAAPYPPPPRSAAPPAGPPAVPRA